MIPGPVDTLKNAVITGAIWRGLVVTTRDGKPAKLAIVDENGTVIEDGPAVARECWNIVLQVHRNYLMDVGYLIVHSSPPGIGIPIKESAPDAASSPRAGRLGGRGERPGPGR